MLAWCFTKNIGADGNESVRVCVCLKVKKPNDDDDDKETRRDARFQSDLNRAAGIYYSEGERAVSHFQSVSEKWDLFQASINSLTT